MCVIIIILIIPYELFESTQSIISMAFKANIPSTKSQTGNILGVKMLQKFPWLWNFYFSIIIISLSKTLSIILNITFYVY